MTRATTLPPRGKRCEEPTNKQGKQELPKAVLKIKGRTQKHLKAAHVSSSRGRPGSVLLLPHSCH